MHVLLKFGLGSLLVTLTLAIFTISVFLLFRDKQNEVSSSNGITKTTIPQSGAVTSTARKGNLTTTAVSVVTTSSTTFNNTSTVTTPMIQSIYSSVLNDVTQSYCRRVSCTNSAYYFQAIQLNVSTTGNYIITSNSSMDTFGYLYTDNFIPPLPTIYLISSDDDSGGNGQFMLNITLQANRNYVLVVTTYTAYITGTFSIIAVGRDLLAFSPRYIPTTNTTMYFNTTVSYGTLTNLGIDDSDQGYVVINGIDVVGQTGGIINRSYVEQVSFAFYASPTSSKPGIWLYVMNRTDSTNVFTPTTVYQLPYSLIRVGVIGLQTIPLPSNALLVRAGQYVAVGFDSSGGSCYRVSNRNQYYINTFEFQSVSTATYGNAPTGGFAFSFVVRTLGYISY